MKLIALFIIMKSICIFSSAVKIESDSNAKIFRGKDATKDMFPYYVELEIEFIEPIEELDRKDIKKFKERLKSILGESNVPREIIVDRNGGGVLISKKHILTAAHLFYPSYKGIVMTENWNNLDFEAKAYGGIYDLRKKDKSQIRNFSPKDVQLYPSNGTPDPLEQKHFFEYDVAMILLSKPFDLSKPNPKIMSVCLPNKKYEGTVNIESIGKKKDIIILGTGDIDSKGTRPYILQFAKVKLIPADDCYKRWGSPSNLKLDSEIKKKGFCVKGISKEMSCKGDSGAPAILEYGIINPIYDTDGKDYLIGIGRSGQKLCDTENGNLKPSFNVKIPGNVLEWILKIGGNDIKEQQENLEC